MARGEATTTSAARNLGVIAYDDGWARILNGDCRDVLRSLPAESVHCVVTSPPYWGLRDYGLPPAIWGGNPEHEHEWVGAVFTRKGTLQYRSDASADCLCGAWRGSLGLEPTPEAYVAHMVEVFRELHRVLRPGGVAWLNLAGTYYGSGGAGGDYAEGGLREGQPTWKQRVVDPRSKQATNNAGDIPAPHRQGGGGRWKPKDYVPIPWLVALALQADGWWLRSEIIWAKKAPMPESVTDRPTRSHEQVFLLAKSTTYFYDAIAIQERADGASSGGRQYAVAKGNRAIRGQVALGSAQSGSTIDSWADNGARNKHDVWLLGPSPYPEAHFATYPPELVQPCILAGTSAKGACAECGASWQRTVAIESSWKERKAAGATAGNVGVSDSYQNAVYGTRVDHDLGPKRSETTGWQPTCEHIDADTVPCTVLDPFAGSGTTLAVAKQLGRRSIGIELSEAYCKLAAKRIGAVTLPMAGVAG